MVVATAGSMGMPPNHNSYTIAASSTAGSHSDSQHAPAASVEVDSAPEPLPWLVIESGQEPNHEQSNVVNPTVPPKEPSQPLPPAEPAAVTTMHIPSVQPDRLQDDGQAVQRQDDIASEHAPVQEHQPKQLNVDRQAEQPAQHPVVYGPMPEDAAGPVQLHQVCFETLSCHMSSHCYFPMLLAAAYLPGLAADNIAELSNQLQGQEVAQTA